MNTNMARKPTRQDKPQRQLANRRLELGLKQSDVYNLTGISITQISRMERCEIDPSYEEAGLFADALHTTRQKLFPDIVWGLNQEAAKWTGLTQGAEQGGAAV